MMALIDPGDEVLYPDPGFPGYASITLGLGGIPVPFLLSGKNHLQPDPKEIAAKITSRTKVLITNSPGNPTGTVYTDEVQRQLAELAVKHDLLVLSDEIYSRLIFAGDNYSIVAEPGFKERTILLDGFSKTYAMTGWRMGYGVMRADLAKQIALLATNATSCTASFTQMAGIEALRGDQSPVEKMKAEFQRRRDAFVGGLNRIKGFSCRLPGGAFYAFPNITATGWKSRALADALLNQAGVACLSGTAFGEFGEGYLRFSIANSLENLLQALERIDKWTKANL